MGEAAMKAAQELAHHCQVRGVSEAAAVVSILMKLASDSHDNSSGSDARLRQCRSIVMMLERAAKVAGKVSSGCSGFLSLPATQKGARRDFPVCFWWVVTPRTGLIAVVKKRAENKATGRF